MTVSYGPIRIYQKSFGGEGWDYTHTYAAIEVISRNGPHTERRNFEVLLSHESPNQAIRKLRKELYAHGIRAKLTDLVVAQEREGESHRA
jgi:hypothetical protein